MNFSELASKASDKTRILIVSKNAELLKIFQQIAELNSVSINVIRNNNDEVLQADFVAAQTSDDVVGAEFHPTIVLIAADSSEITTPALFEKITGGGILIYPENLALPSTENYFRRITFSEPEITETPDGFALETEMGSIPIQISSEETIQEIPGLLLLCHQVGIMDDEFYDALLNLETSN